MEFLVELSGVCRSFADGNRHVDVLKDLDLKIAAGEFIAIVGPSGAGKSSILNIISGLDMGFTGTANIFGQSLFGMSDDTRSQMRNRKLGFIFQSFHLLPQLSVLENVCVPKWLDTEKTDQSKLEKQALLALKTVGLEAHAAGGLGALSGGERQRVAIARAMVNEPDLILADEPTGNLDRMTGESVVGYFEKLRANGDRAVIVVTHDENISKRADRVLELDQGCLR
jgi:ABC-type lipoprotein export system ATPase subunit